ncbi:sugar ABC transporter ATP-binding protein [Curtobacterium sp. MCBD17_034]|uniref:ATP-binding cassette domain-containing protein n=1 Tax=unclassified Curtobacterium TaxID=257496 RepID=UPI000DAA11F3|nr:MULTISPECIES: ATP-binding cassette domain-containing protein [unclassified Curtobacterium]PZE76536.1 sugar ABC transporter ATP-binding protein [Curtobacterium sp. MCBD17_019]PZF61217.1 sugar ABC transporter ATP-binding protein [Curtobacterium sp. MCBD17_034]PZM33127.1 sugar ABC transporter ATP-binding protein [Curtobacterium sp. MCBD17_031]WIB64566.1 ATP-binding cassette domain-containing protein [Curtobacterium sp. MCBD17_040]WIE55594.1 ATP-binding cassette domain-containing protein [Curto
MTTTTGTGTTDRTPGGTPPALEARHVSKRFGSVTALRDINLHVGKGEVLGLIGDNGAGKSTLIKILTGYHQPTEGELFLNGDPVTFTGIGDARERGIETVFQDLALVNTLPVYLNLYLNKELRRGPFLRRSEMRENARRYLDDIGIRIASVNDEVANLSGGQRQAIAVARSVYSDARILLLDEPLAAMGAKEGGIILDFISMLRERGEVSIILIAHNYTQVFDVCDRVNLLQHGEITLDKRTDEVSAEEVLDMVAKEYRRGGRLAEGRGRLLDEVR